MNKEFFKKILGWPKPYITGTDLLFLLGRSSNSRQGVVKRAIKEGILTRLRRDLYLIEVRPNQSLVDLFELAPIIYGPSTISFESALQFHGWIPEAAVVTTSATTKRTKEFETQLGIFSYRHIPVSAFSMGVNQYKREQSVHFITDPWRALADMIYIQKRSWGSLEALREDLRIEKEAMEATDRHILDYLAKHYPNERTREVLKGLIHGH